jgi:hypothetical protein
LTVATLSLALVGVARADISAYLEPVYEGFLTEYPETYVISYDLKVSVPEGDAWTVAGGVELGEPWIYLYGGVFFQHPMGSACPPDPALFWQSPDLRYDCFYTAHSGWPNTEDQGNCPGLAEYLDAPTELIAAWWLTPDGNDYSGDVTIARFTVIPDAPEWCMEVHVLVGSRETAPTYFYFGPLSGCCPADLDGDRDVDLADLAELLANYGTTSGATYWDGDLDGDDDVDLEDLAELLSVYGADC